MTSIVDAFIISLVVSLIVGLAWYLWYALALSVVFVKLGRPSWKGWVPIVNEAEILVLGGVPAWSVVYYFIPIVDLYGLYLKITAVHRINLQFGRGAGMTVLGILLPPVWASMLAWGKAPASEFDKRVASMLPTQDEGVGPLAGKPAPATPGLPANRVGPIEPEKPIVALRPAPIEANPAPPVAPVAPVVAQSSAVDEGTSERPRTTPSFIVNPWAQPAAEPAAQQTTPEVPPPVSARVPAERVDATEGDGEIGDGDGEIGEEDDDEYAATVVVDRRPRFAWSLVLDSGKTFAITADRVALGRNPVSDDPDAQLLSLPDSSRTLSKTHATIHFAEGKWTVTDLDSTNGVVVVGDDDAETLLAPGRSAQVPGRFILGKVGMLIAPDANAHP